MAGRKNNQITQQRRDLADAIRSVEQDIRHKRFGLTGKEPFNGETIEMALRNRLRAAGLRIDPFAAARAASTARLEGEEGAPGAEACPP